LSAAKILQGCGTEEAGICREFSSSAGTSPIRKNPTKSEPRAENHIAVELFDIFEHSSHAGVQTDCEDVASVSNLGVIGASQEKQLGADAPMNEVNEGEEETEESKYGNDSSLSSESLKTSGKSEPLSPKEELAALREGLAELYLSMAGEVGDKHCESLPDVAAVLVLEQGLRAMERVWVSEESSCA